MISFRRGAFRYFFGRRQSIIPSIVFYMVIYYLRMTLALLAGTVLGPLFLSAAFYRILVFPFLILFGDRSAYLP